MDSGREVDLNYLENRIKQGLSPVPSLDAVVITGGEPLIQPQAIIETAKLVKKYDLQLMLDTNGTIADAMTKVLQTGLFDRVALDVKSPLIPSAFSKISGVPQMAIKHVKAIRYVLELCNELSIPIEARTTVVPGISDEEYYIKMIANRIKNKIDVYYLQQYDNLGDVLDTSLKEKNPPPKEKMIRLAKIAIEEGVSNVYIKTRFDGLELIE
jgi:pyruvate formate lyase activating enzyme